VTGSLASRRAAVEHLLRELGVVSSTGMVGRGRDFDGFELQIMLPIETEEVKLSERALLHDLPAAVETVATARDRLYARVLGYMSEHDTEIAAMLRRQQDALRRRDELIRIIDGMARTGRVPEVKP